MFKQHVRVLFTWIPRTAIGAGAIPRNCFNQVLQRTLIARLLTFIQGRRHVSQKEERIARRLG
jgi:hypothetical protein